MSTSSEQRLSRRRQYGESQLEPPLGQEYDRRFRPARDTAEAHKTEHSRTDLFGTALGYTVAVGLGGVVGTALVVAAAIGAYAGIRELVEAVW